MRDFGIVCLVAVVGVGAYLVGGADRTGVAYGQGYPGGTADSDGRIVAVTGTIGSGVSVLWVIDSVDRRLAIYQCKGGKTIELVAARNIEWDFKIDTLNDVSSRSPDHLRRLFLRGSGKDAPEVYKPEDTGTGSGEKPESGGNVEDD